MWNGTIRQRVRKLHALKVVCLHFWNSIHLSPSIHLPQNDNVTQSNGHNGSSLGGGNLWTLIFLPQEFSASSTNKAQNNCIFIPYFYSLQFPLWKAETALHHWAGVMSLVERQHALLKKHKAQTIPARSEEQKCLWKNNEWEKKEVAAHVGSRWYIKWAFRVMPE